MQLALSKLPNIPNYKAYRNHNHYYHCSGKVNSRIAIDGVAKLAENPEGLKYPEDIQKNSKNSITEGLEFRIHNGFLPPTWF